MMWPHWSPVLRTKKRLPKPAAPGERPQTCRRCDLWKHATQAVEGEGKPAAKIMLVGEQPGDEEDVRGHPFVGPAGRVLDEVLAAAGLARKDLFITNAVKHFKWEPRGKRRLHKKPGSGEIDACQVWLEREIAAIKPLVVVALGATALRALTGATLSIDSARRQELRHPGGARILATYHPSAILRAQDEWTEELRTFLVGDLRLAAQIASGELP
jgi:DNA polymerase